MDRLNNIKELHIGNVLEAYYKTYENLHDEEKGFWRKYDSLENNRALLYNGDNKVVVTPTNISKLHFNNICRLAGWVNVHNIIPHTKSDTISIDILKDENIIDIIKSNPGVKIIPYRHTSDFFELIKYLRTQKFDFKLPETVDKNNRFIESYFHSKRGFRHLWEISNDTKLKIKIPEGFITSDKLEAIEACWWFKTNGKGVVIKFNRGVQGIGIIMIDKDEFPEEKRLFDIKINNILSEDFWDSPTIIVEEKLNINHNIMGGSPSIEFRIDENGIVHKEYPCEQILAEDNKTFIGSRINKELYENTLIKTAFKAGENFGKKLSQYGYRGFFDIDLVVVDDKTIYAVESNLRRTGVTHIHQFSKTMLGENYTKNYNIESIEIKNLPLKISAEIIYKKIGSKLFSINKGYGIIPVNPDMASVGLLSLMYVGRTKWETKKLRKFVDLTFNLKQTQ